MYKTGKIAIIACAIAGAFLCGLFIDLNGCPDGDVLVNNDCISITSVKDGQEVHSKVVIDAHVTGNVTAITVDVNGTVIANYVPYTWNNIEARAGNYNITVTATLWKTNSTIRNKSFELNITRSVMVIIPEKEIYIGDRNNFTEPHVIHEGQDVIWANGTVNFTRVEVRNGGNPYNTVSEPVDVYGNLTVINCTIVAERYIFIRKNSSVSFYNCTVHGQVCTCDMSSMTVMDSFVHGVSAFGHSRIEMINSTYQTGGWEDNGTLVIL